MLDAQLSNLDTEKLIKLRELMSRGSSEGERQAAQNKATALAERSCMTLEQALTALDTLEAVEAPAPASPQKEESAFQQVFREMREERERNDPGCLAREAAEIARKRQEVIDRYGSEDAVFEETERERLLERALVPLREAGIRADFMASSKPEVMAAIRSAYPMPETIVGAWAEYNDWEMVTGDRYMVDGIGQCYDGISLRQHALQEFILTMPSTGTGDLKARMEFIAFKNTCLGWYSEELQPHIEALQTDINRMIAKMQELQRGQAERPQPPASRSTNAAKADRVKALLRSDPDLSDREIARRAGVSPQTVGNWRRNLENKGCPANQGKKRPQSETDK